MSRARCSAALRWASFSGTTRSRASSWSTSTSARVSSRSIVCVFAISIPGNSATNGRISQGPAVKTLVNSSPLGGEVPAKPAEGPRSASVQRDGVAQLVEEAPGDLLGLAGQSPHLAQHRLLLGREVLG